MRTMLHARLRHETAADHRRVEARLDLLSPHLSMQQYQRVLRAFYGFYEPVEKRLGKILPPVRESGFPLPARARFLMEDLLDTGATPTEMSAAPRCRSLPAMCNIEQASGCLYVLEGASLGGQIIARSVRRRLGVRKGFGATFFVGYGNATGSRWKRVLEWLEATVREGAESEVIVASARETFHSFEAWLASQDVFE